MPPSSASSWCGLRQWSRWSRTAAISSGSSAPSTNPGASSRTRSQVMAMSDQTFLAGGCRHTEGQEFGPTVRVANELLAHGDEPEPHAALYGAQRGVGVGCDLALGEAVEVGELDDFPLGGRKRRQRLANLLGIEPAGHFRPDVGDSEGCRKGVVRFVPQSHTNPLAPYGVDRSVAD